MPRRHYTPELANRSLKLVARIASDVRDTARRIQSAWQELQQASGGAPAGTAALDELRLRYTELVGELEQLGVELKDPLTGLLDFRARRRGVEVYLCWRIGEPAVAHWHTLDGGFAGRRPMSEY